MDTKRAEFLLNRYFEGETNEKEELSLKEYFLSGDVDEALKEYEGFFKGICQNQTPVASDFEEDVMNFILDNEQKEKNKFRWMWRTISGIAASIILVLGGFLFYEQQNKNLKDTFDDPEKAYAFAEETMQFVSEKYNKGLENMTYFEKIGVAKDRIEVAISPVNEVMEKYLPQKEN